MPHITLPGGHADLIDPATLHAGHQDDYWDLLDEIREKKQAAQPVPELDPANPAVMPDRPAPRLGRRDTAPLYDLVAGWAVTACSFPGVVPWTPDSRKAMPLGAWNKLRDAIDGQYVDLLVGNAPKESEETEPGSAPSS